MSGDAERYRHIERAAAMLASRALESRIDYAEWVHLCKLAYGAAIKQQIENDLADERGERLVQTWRVYRGEKND